MKDIAKKYPHVIQILELREKKSQDYNSNIQLTDYFPFGQISYSQMIHTKALRLRNLTENKEAPNFEGIRDTLMDIVNYALFNIEAIDRGDFK